MRLTPQFVEALKVLKHHGYKRVASWVGSYYDTTYVKAWDIDYLIETSKEYSSIRAVRPAVRKGMWRGHLNERDLTSTDIRTQHVLREAERLRKQVA